VAADNWLEKADRYLVTAQLLLEIGDTESAISRAYYGARYAAIHLFLTRRVGWKPEWQHDTISNKITEQARHLSWLHAVKLPTLKTFGQSWNELLENRSNADYRFNKTDRQMAQRSLAFARAVVAAIRENVP